MNAAPPAIALTSADVVYYGNYPQSGTSPDFNEEPILWRVLDTSGDRALLLSEKILDGGMWFNPGFSDTVPYYAWWSESSIRKFLNGSEYVASVSRDVTGIVVTNPRSYSFYERAFSLGEASGIIKAEVDNASVNEISSVTAGPKTEDKIFLLSYAEATTPAYGFADNRNADISRKAEVTSYGSAQGVYSEEDGNKKGSWWWLRSHGEYVSLASFVYFDGGLNSNVVGGAAIGLRPAFRLNLESLLFSSPAKGGKVKGVNAELKKQTYDGKYTHAPSSRAFTEHKLTLATNTYKLESANVTSGAIAADTNIDVRLEYTGASTGGGYHLAVAVTSGDRALYYGQIKSLETADDAAGIVTFTIPEYRDGEEVYLFVEGRNNNGDYKTDFAGLPVHIAGTVRNITVSPSELTLIAGYDKKLTAVFEPQGSKEEIIWSSNNEAVAAVDATTGVVSALMVGSATITATTKESDKSAECKVTVTEASSPLSLTLIPSAMTVRRGVTEKITASFSGIAEEPLVWKSSDEKIAMVDNAGKVTALSEGSCTITATTEDDAYNASCEIKVIKETVVHRGGSRSGGGCNTGLGLGALALLALVSCAVRKTKR